MPLSLAERLQYQHPQFEPHRTHWQQVLAQFPAHTSSPNFFRHEKISLFSDTFAQSLHPQLVAKAANHPFNYFCILTTIFAHLWRKIHPQSPSQHIAVSWDKGINPWLPMVLTLVEQTPTWREAIVAFKQNLQNSQQWQDFPLALLADPNSLLPEWGSLGYLSAPDDTSGFAEHIAQWPAALVMVWNEEFPSLALWLDANSWLPDQYAPLQSAFEQLTQAFLQQADADIRLTSLANPTDLQQLKALQPPASPFPEQPLSTLFQLVAETQAHSPALRTETGATLTFAEVWTLSSRLAVWLKQCAEGELSGCRVGLHLPSGKAEAVGLMLALWRLGASYVPIDPLLPDSRKQWIATDSGLVGMVSETALPNALLHKPVWVLPGVLPEATDFEPADNASREAYLLYTSGTTGQPKGCSISHRNAASLLCNEALPFVFSTTDKWCVLHQWGFDFSVWELWGGLLHGGQVLLLSRETVQDMPRLVELLTDYRPTVLNQTPQAFYALQGWLSATGQINLLPDLRYIIFGGDRLSVSALAPWLQARGYEAPALVNMYGITETTVHVTYHQLTAADLVNEDTGSPIGKPLPGMQVWVMDGDGQPLPVGFWGELWVSGTGVSEQGYHARAELTAARFVVHPDLGRLYRSGDVGQWTSHGLLRHRGRIDRQLKVRGHRLEAAEIEAVVLLQAGIRQAYAYVDEAGRLLLYYVGEASLAELQALAAEFLPPYAQPQHWIALDALPLTLNGKMDERRLPAPTTSTEASQPLSATEQPLAELWSALLGIPAAGLAPTANFFSLGGDSVQAIQLLSRLASQGHRVRLRDFLQTPTLQHLATLCSQSEPTQALASLPPEAIALRNRLQSQVAACYPDQAHHIEAVYELSPAQAGMLAGWLRYGDQGAYYEQMHYTLRSTLPPEVWQAAWQAVVAAHPMLRTHFVWEGVEEPAQVVWQAGSQPDGYTYTDLSQLDRAAQQDYLRNYRTQQAAQGIAADRAPLMRLSVFGLGQGRYAMEWTHSHLLMDGWCLQPLLQAFAQAAHRPTVALPSTPGYQTYLDYLWQVDKAAQQRYWQTYLRDLQAHTRLPAYRPTGQDYQAATISWRLDKATSAALQTLCQQWGIRSAVLWQGLWAGLLASYQGSNSQGQYEVLTGLLSAGRPSEVAEIETMIGLFVQALPLRVQAAGSDPVQAVMQALQASYIGWQAHQYSSVAAIQREATGLAAPLYNHVLIVENYPFDASNTDSPWTVETFEAQEQTHFDLNWVVYPPQQADEPFKGKVLFNQHVLDTQIVEAMIAQLQRLAEALLQAPTWQQWLQTASQFPEPASATTATTAATATLLPVRLQTVCQQQASQVAISWEDSPDALTYASLALLAGQIAQLVQAQVPPQTCVGICMPKQACLPALMWGVWQAGCYFVYLDPSLPSKRLQALVDQAQCGCLIGDPAAAALPILDWRTTPPPPPNFPPRVAAPHDCAYLIMTSGSTGVPKAVAISHANVANLIAWAVPQYAPFAVQTVLSGTSPAFDLSIFEYFYALCAGKHLKMLRDNLQIERFLHLPDLLINTVPSVLKALVKADLSRVTVVNTAGEPIQRDTVAALLAFPQLHCFNLYAPSETTTYSTCHAFARDEQGPVSIGKPLLNTEILILDEALNPLPAFASGEIWIGGQGVAQGYLGDEAQTQAKFRTLPDRQGRWYRTGDFAYKLPSGALVFEGRKDNLLKIRGFRIELEEINHWLRQQPAVRDAFSVVYLEKIYAFVCTDADNWQPVQCLEALSATLPAYMLPFQLLRVEALPTNANGKIDAKALLAQLAEIAPNIATAPREATTPAEQILVRLCQQLLSQPNLHLGDNFFALGGDSIVAMQLVGQLKTQGWDCAYAQVFAAADLGALADALTPLTKATPVVQPLRAHRLEANPLSPIQQWFLARFQGNINHFNQSVLLSTQLPLDLDTLREAVAQVLADHPILRTPFDPHTRTYWAIQPVETVLAQLHGHTWAAFDEPTWETLANQAQSSLSLPEGRLWAMEIVQTPQRTYWLWVIHHWVVDGVSWRILLDSLLQNYQQIQQGQRQQPGIPTLAFADWLGYLDNHCQQTWESEQAYWAELQPSIRQTSGLIAVASDTYADTQVSTMSLDAETTRRLLFEAPKHYQAEVNHLLLSALWRAWWQLTQQKTLAICLEGHGREPIHPEAEVFHTVGWFTSLFPVALQSEATTWEQLVQAIGQQLQQIPQKGLAYLQAHLKQPDLFALPSICFNYLGQYDTMQQSTLFRWETLPQGAAVDPAATRLFAIEINAWVVGQCLHIQMSAGHSLQNLHIAAWANAFVQQLTDLVQAAGGLAQQALPAKETTAYLSTEELRNIEDLIEGLE